MRIDAVDVQGLKKLWHSCCGTYVLGNLPTG